MRTIGDEVKSSEGVDKGGNTGKGTRPMTVGQNAEFEKLAF